jgi:putative MFS transporter
MDSKSEKLVRSLTSERTRRYIIYLVIVMGMIAIMDQYLSIIKTTSIDYILNEYSVSESKFSLWEAIYFIPTFFIFLLNGLTDIIGRKFSLLILILLMGIPSICIVYLTPSFHFFMMFYAITIFATVSNMWAIPISEESPAEKRGNIVAVVYVIGLIPLQAILPPLIVPYLGWKWMYGVMFLLMIPVLILWFFMKETKRYEAIKEERAKGLKKKHIFGFGVINKSDLRYIFFSASIWMCWLVVSLFALWAGHYFTQYLFPELSESAALTSWSIVLLAFLISMMVGGVAGGWTMDKVGRKTGLLIGCIGLALSFCIMGFVPRLLFASVTTFTGFFLSFSYSWIIVYIPEIFPTERRGSCMGWTTTVARVSYIIGPALASFLLGTFSRMEWFWAVAGLIMIIPIILVFLFHPYETKTKELEAIEAQR